MTPAAWPPVNVQLLRVRSGGSHFASCFLCRCAKCLSWCPCPGSASQWHTINHTIPSCGYPWTVACPQRAESPSRGLGRLVQPRQRLLGSGAGAAVMPFGSTSCSTCCLDRGTIVHLTVKNSFRRSRVFVMTSFRNVPFGRDLRGTGTGEKRCNTAV